MMKTTIKLILFCVLCSAIFTSASAQEVNNPQEEFLENTWYLSKIEIDGTVYPFESNEETEYTTLTPEQIEGQTNFYLDYCFGAVRHNLTFTSDSSFVIDDFVVPLAECDDPENNRYSIMYFDVFEDNLHEEVEYVITMENNHKNLVMTTQDNSKIYYQNANMSVNNQQKPNLSIYPNPAEDFFYIENLTKPAQIEIYNLSGKVLLRQEVNETTKQVNVSQLSDGIYLYQFHQKGQQVKMGKLVKK